MPGVSRAEDDDQAACLAASDKAQDLRAAGKLVAARSQLLGCVRDVCPKVVVTDCAQWLKEVEHATPSLSILARDHTGRDVLDVKVFVDDGLWLASLDGRSHPVDPGPHKLRFEAERMEPVTEDVLAHVGEHDRTILVTLDAATSANVVTVTTVAPKPNRSAWMKPTGAIVLGVGAAVSVVGGILGIVATSDWDRAVGLCSTGLPCANLQAQSLERHAGTAADWSTALLIGGGVGALTGLVLLLVAPNGTETARIGFTPTPGGMSFSASGTF